MTVNLKLALLAASAEAERAGEMALKEVLINLANGEPILKVSVLGGVTEVEGPAEEYVDFIDWDDHDPWFDEDEA